MIAVPGRVDRFRASPDNVAPIPASALGPLNPLLTGPAVALWSILVAPNRLRLRSYVASRRGAAGA